jgi:RNA polymerase sigma-54 factor
MAHGLALKQTQTQKLVMTQELRQAIAILQMPSHELLQHVQKQVEENPLLELEEDNSRAELPQSEEAEPDWAEYFRDCGDLGFPPQSTVRRKGPSWADFIGHQHTLAESLSAQWGLEAQTPQEKQIGEFIIGCLDEYGYLHCSISEIASRLGQPSTVVLRILRAIQRLEPIGAGARNLEECLLIQAESLGLLTPEIRQVILHYLPDLAQGRFGRIAQGLGLTMPQVQSIRDLIRTLDPKPGRQFDDGCGVHYITPDVVVHRLNDDYVILVNDAIGNRLHVGNHYRRILTDPKNVDEQAKQYVEAKLNSALWLIRSIEQRRLTIYRIVEKLLKLQRPFFDHGVRYLHPLTLREVATQIDVHESTVSRATARKHIETPHGVFPLRILFDSGVESANGKGAAAESVKRLLADLIAQEDPYNPYSDQQLSDLLGGKGINLSRRTVAKYRHDVNIPSSGCRRRYEQANG